MAHEIVVRAMVADELKVLTPNFLRVQGWELNNIEHPQLDVTFLGSRPLRVRLNYEDWPDRAPAAELLEASGEVLTVGATSVFNMSSHPITHRPFVCMRGFNEFHTHDSHLTERWENYRDEEGNNLVGLLMQLAHSWRTVHPR